MVVEESYLNTATAQQALGLYPQSCDSILGAFELQDKTDCNILLEQAQVIEPQLGGVVPLSQEVESEILPDISDIEKYPDTPGKVIGLLRFGDYLRESGYPRVATKALELGLSTTDNLQDANQKTATLLSLGNAQRAIALEKQNQFPAQTVVLNIIANSGGTADAALAPYQPALDYYDSR